MFACVYACLYFHVFNKIHQVGEEMHQSLHLLSFIKVTIWKHTYHTLFGSRLYIVTYTYIAYIFVQVHLFCRWIFSLALAPHLNQYKWDLIQKGVTPSYNYFMNACFGSTKCRAARDYRVYTNPLLVLCGTWIIS